MEPITEQWLRDVGFKWHQLDRQPDKHWLLWLGDVVNAGSGFSGTDDLGIEVTRGRDADRNEYWFCWLRADYSRRYGRFVHIRHLHFQRELIALIEGITGHAWDPANNLYGSMRTPEIAARMREEEKRRAQRFDVQLLQPNWHETEKDDSRGRPLIEHMQAAEDARTKKGN